MDMKFDTKSQLEMSRSTLDFNGINTLKTAAKNGDKGALEEAAKQFEAIFVKMLLSSMRKAQDAIADEDSPFNSQQVKFYRDMHDQQLASDLSSNGSIGLADIIINQMDIDKSATATNQHRSNANLDDIHRYRALMQEQANKEQVNKKQQTESVTPASVQKQAAFVSPKHFVEQLYDKAVSAAEKLNIDPKALLAQAAVETGWGKYVIQQADGDSTHNLFGIKADKRWDGQKAQVDTLEYVNQVPEKQQASFRSYANFADSLNDYVDFIQSNPRYDKALEKTDNVESYFTSLQQAGYATDPNYAQKVMSVFNGSLLNSLLP